MVSNTLSIARVTEGLCELCKEERVGLTRHHIRHSFCSHMDLSATRIAVLSPCWSCSQRWLQSRDWRRDV